MLPATKFKSTNGNWFTRGLFLEEITTDTDSVLYTLKPEDYKGYPSIYKLYMASASEYEFANEYLGGFEHWEVLQQCLWMKPYILLWRREVKARQESVFKARMTQIAADPTHKEYYQANKYLLNATEKPAGAGKRGAPTRAEVSAAAHQQAQEARRMDADFIRVSQPTGLPSKPN